MLLASAFIYPLTAFGQPSDIELQQQRKAKLAWTVNRFLTRCQVLEIVGRCRFNDSRSPLIAFLNIHGYDLTPLARQKVANELALQDVYPDDLVPISSELSGSATQNRLDRYKTTVIELLNQLFMRRNQIDPQTGKFILFMESDARNLMWVFGLSMTKEDVERWFRGEPYPHLNASTSPWLTKVFQELGR